MALNKRNRWSTAVSRIIPSLFLSTSVWAQTAGPSDIAIPPRPLWSELTVAEKIILTPLADEWDSLEPFRRGKWLEIAARFSSSSPEEQRRLHAQMGTWRESAPEERLPADEEQEPKHEREAYSSLPAGKRGLERRISSRLVEPLTPVVPARVRSPAWEAGKRIPLRILPLPAKPASRREGAGSAR